MNVKNNIHKAERSSLPSKNFPCISMDMLQIGALVLLGRPVEADYSLGNQWPDKNASLLNIPQSLAATI